MKLFKSDRYKSLYNSERRNVDQARKVQISNASYVSLVVQSWLARKLTIVSLCRWTENIKQVDSLDQSALIMFSPLFLFSTPG